ncbi:lytic murein transglycosylase B [Paucibacter sp. APW11]|uniref:Lytic murein transglycosylase B n=1 Tax=Roseateles aquae TaxID=3077235 RepID=A0ABU3PAH5_9BURK|nr:lytic murein transglycosylase B [Paucibacter sp. APW11]MDT8999098.1 lytic murein transglycosylase B [Paucibacter sp. APW11]
MSDALWRRAAPLALVFATLLTPPATEAAPPSGPKHQAKHRAKARPSAQAAAAAYGQRADVVAFAEVQAEGLGLSPDALAQLLAQARKVPAVQKLIMPPPVGTAKDWSAYRARFVEPRRLQAGLAFWQAHEAALTRAEEQFGVPAEIIAGIIGVETFYGQIMGGFRVLDALATLSFDFPPGRKDRSEFFRSELIEFLRLTKREGLDPLAVKGSYAGAIGYGQFMPGSWNRHAVDFDADGRIDLIASPADAIGSVANFLAQHGWQRGMPTHYSVQLPVDTTARAALLAPDITPSFSAAQLAERGAQLSEAGQEHAGLLAVVELQNGSAAPSYLAGTQNFYTLTRYNWSAYYAMGVIELGRSLATLRRAQ